MPAGGAGGSGGGNRGKSSGGAGRNGGSTRTQASCQTATKGVEKKAANKPVKSIKEKFVVAKEKALAKKAEKKASHDARKGLRDDKDDAALRQERTTRQQNQGNW